MGLIITSHGVDWKYLYDKVSDRIYTLDTPWIFMVEDFIRADICPSAKKHINKILADHPDYTVGDVFTNIPPKPVWARIGLRIFDGHLDKDVYMVALNCAAKDYMQIYKLWKDLIYITEEKRDELREKFRGKLPTVEKKIAEDEMNI